LLLYGDGYLLTFGSVWSIEGAEFDGPPAQFAGWRAARELIR